MLFLPVPFGFHALCPGKSISYSHDSVPCEEGLKPLEKFPHFYSTIILQFLN